MVKGNWLFWKGNSMLEKDIKKMNSIKWWHKIALGETITSGQNEESQSTFDAINLGDTLKGKTVIDIGCWDGFYSFACEQLGADSVVACDRHVWDEPSITDAGFDFAHQMLNSKVKKVHSNVEDLPKKNLGKFDVVLMLGVLYHSKNPIQYIEIARDLSKGIVVFETAVDLLNVPVPAVRYYVHDEYHGDPTNFWGFNELAMKGMMKDAGFKNIQSVKLSNNTRMLFIGEV
jgi:tRNA (mo5U34)-methyltransferase